jgi:hypothetical protein
MTEPLRIRIPEGWVVLTDYVSTGVNYCPPQPYPGTKYANVPPQLTITLEARGPFSFEFDSTTEQQ